MMANIQSLKSNDKKKTTKDKEHMLAREAFDDRANLCNCQL